MLLRGTRPFLLIAGLAVTSVIAFACPSAGATPLPGVIAKTVTDSSSDDFVIDGMDIYWLGYRNVRFKNGSGADTILYRTSFFDGTKVQLLRASVEAGDEIETLKAGGGFVAVEIQSTGFIDHTTRSSSRVVRISRDGSSQSVIAEGALTRRGDIEDAPFYGKGLLSDCGTSVDLQDVSTTGEVIVGQVQRERKGKACGGASNTNTWQYVGISPNGETRQLLTTQAAVSSDFKVHHDGDSSGDCNCDDAGSREIKTFGEWATVLGLRSLTLLNMTTGAQTPPYAVSLKGDYHSAFATADPTGRLAAYAYAVSYVPKKRPKRAQLKQQNFLFPNPANPTIRIPVSTQAFMTFCGSRLISLSPKSKKIAVTELDPATGAAVRSLGDINDMTGAQFNGCDQNFMFYVRTVSKGSKVLAIPLG